MTAVMPERTGLSPEDALALDLYKVFVQHGIPCDWPDVRQIWQGGQLAGVTVTAYERPAALGPVTLEGSES